MTWFIDSILSLKRPGNKCMILKTRKYEKSDRKGTELSGNRETDEEKGQNVNVKTNPEARKRWNTPQKRSLKTEQGNIQVQNEQKWIKIKSRLKVNEAEDKKGLNLIKKGERKTRGEKGKERPLALQTKTLRKNSTKQKKRIRNEEDLNVWARQTKPRAK